MDQSRQNPFPRLLASLLFLASSAPITESIAQERPRNSSNQPKALVRATSKTHRAINYPIILSGGKNMGFKHGSHLNYGDHIPLSNLFLTIANQLGHPTNRFADSTADITEVLA